MVLAAFLIGAALGAWQARRRKGTTADMAQWGAAYGILFGLVALVLAILLGRAG